ncbi:hypothetical protein PENSPDRAFT_681454 [Peniophora sp. CONT]|nr:hypothetical protein PENSPDRAFT_681454 [Peniophora sp. CONT]
MDDTTLIPSTDSPGNAEPSHSSTPELQNILGRLDEMARDSTSAFFRNDLYHGLEMQLTGTLAILETGTRLRQDMAAAPPATAHSNGSSEDLSTPLKSTAGLAERVERSLFASTDQVLLDFYEAQLAACQVSIRAGREGNSLLSQEQSEELVVEETRYQKLVDHERSKGAPALEHEEG